MRLIFILLLALTVQACAPTSATRGNFVRDSEVAAILPGASQTEVLQKLGTPTTKAVFDDKVWYYVGEKTEQTSFYRPEVKERSVYEARFDEAGLLASLTKLDGVGQDIELESKATPAHGKSMSIIQQMLGNLGRYNTAGSKGAPQVPGT